MSDATNRRNFLKQATAAGLSLGLAGEALAAAKTPGGKGAKLRARKAAPASAEMAKVAGGAPVRIAVIGLNSRGLAHIASLATLPDVTVTHVCDVDSRALAKGVKAVKTHGGNEAQGIKDFRKLLEDKSIDAVSLATPDHWHAPMSIMALAAGKHVYCEKPATHNPFEGELLVAAVKKYGKVFQMGNQRRSYSNVVQAIQEIRSGKLIGRAYFARSWYANGRVGIGVGQKVPVPDWLGADGYDLWQGPAPRKPFQDNVIHYKWHWFWHWGTGEALNNGTHFVDLCRWALAEDFPTRVVSSGGRYHITGQDDWEAPDTQVINWDFADGKGMIWEGRCCNMFPNDGESVGAVIYGTEGSVMLDASNGYRVFDPKGKLVHTVQGRKVDALNTLSPDLPADQQHFYNFIECIRSGKEPRSTAAEGVKTCHLLHLGNIALRTGRLLEIDPATGHIKEDMPAGLWRRDYEKGWDPAQYVTIG